MGIKQIAKRLFHTPLFKNNLWTVEIFDFKGELAGTIDPVLMVLAQNVSIPELAISTEFDHVRKKHYVQTYENPTDVTISFIETEDMRVTQMLDTFEFYTMSKKGGEWTGELTSGSNQVSTPITSQYQKRTIRVNFERFKSLGNQIGDRLIEFANIGGVGLSNLQETNFTETVASYTFKGCSYVGRSSFTLNYEDNPLTIIEATFKIDDMVKKFENPTGKGLFGI